MGTTQSNIVQAPVAPMSPLIGLLKLYAGEGKVISSGDNQIPGRVDKLDNYTILAITVGNPGKTLEDWKLSPGDMAACLPQNEWHIRHYLQRYIARNLKNLSGPYGIPEAEVAFLAKNFDRAVSRVIEANNDSSESERGNSNSQT